MLASSVRIGNRLRVFVGIAMILVSWTIGSVAIATDSLPESATPKFELDIQPILTARGCNSGPCHGKSRGQNGFALSLLAFDSNFDYAAVVEEARGRRLFPAAPQRSLLLEKATGQLPHGGGIRIRPEDEDYRRIVEWIEAGSPRVSAEDPTLVQVTIDPKPQSLEPGQSLPLQVIAHYSDGSKRNVSKTCAYLSNEPAIVSVSPEGMIQASNIPGEATITARYMGVIATWSTAIPRPGEIAKEVYAALPRNNYIDDLVIQKLASLNMLPSEPCSDITFLRRAYLDAIGRLPSVSEVRTFIADTNDNRRERLIDQLLERDEYADYWANKWADLIRPNPYRVGIKATLSLDTWLRQAFRENWSYDQFVRKLITAQGSNWHNGAVTLFRDRREPDEITTMITRLFLGVRLECAKCHQHPFEVYGQSDFYSMASFFARIGYKGTGLSPPISGGEEMVFVRSTGEAYHPLTKAALKPKALAGPVFEVAQGDDPRQQFCDWLTQPDNPYFAKAAVNRIWTELMGKGFVNPVDDLRATNPPSNPELLDALAKDFIASGFDQKKLIKTIMMSRTYALSSMPNETNASDIHNFSRHYRRLMRAEVIADAICDATEVPDRYDGAPIGTRAMQLWTVRTDSATLDAFGRPDPNQDPPCERLPDSTMVQALHLMNAGQLQSKLAGDQGRAARLAATSMTLEQLLDELYLATLSRPPTAEEIQILAGTVQEPNPARRQWVEDVLWSLINSPEFFHID